MERPRHSTSHLPPFIRTSTTRDISKSLVSSPLHMQLYSRYTDFVQQPAKFAIHPNLRPRDISETLTTSPLDIQLRPKYTNPVAQPDKFAVTHIATEEVTGMEERTQAGRGQPSEDRKARKAARRRRYRAIRKASRIENRFCLLGVIQATIQRHLQAVPLRAGCTSFESGTRTSRDMCSWLAKLQHGSKPNAMGYKTVVSN